MSVKRIKEMNEQMNECRSSARRSRLLSQAFEVEHQPLFKPHPIYEVTRVEKRHQVKTTALSSVIFKLFLFYPNMHVRKHRPTPGATSCGVDSCCTAMCLLNLFSTHIRMRVLNCQDCFGYKRKRVDSNSPPPPPPPKRECTGSRSSISRVCFPLWELHFHIGSSQSLEKLATRPLEDQLSNCHRRRAFVFQKHQLTA